MKRFVWRAGVDIVVGDGVGADLGGMAVLFPLFSVSSASD